MLTPRLPESHSLCGPGEARRFKAARTNADVDADDEDEEDEDEEGDAMAATAAHHLPCLGAENAAENQKSAFSEPRKRCKSSNPCKAAPTPGSAAGGRKAQSMASSDAGKFGKKSGRARSR